MELTLETVIDDVFDSLLYHMDLDSIYNLSRTCRGINARIESRFINEATLSVTNSKLIYDYKQSVQIIHALNIKSFDEVLTSRCINLDIEIHPSLHATDSVNIWYMIFRDRVIRRVSFDALTHRIKVHAPRFNTIYRLANILCIDLTACELSVNGFNNINTIKIYHMVTPSMITIRKCSLLSIHIISKVKKNNIYLHAHQCPKLQHMTIEHEPGDPSYTKIYNFICDVLSRFSAWLQT
jgi:hypothetical protein